MFPLRNVLVILSLFVSVPGALWAQEKQKTIAELIYSKPGSWALPALIPYRQGKLWGYADSTGVVKIKPQFTYAGFFKNGLASVNNGELSTVIDASGKPLFKGKYPYMYVDLSGLIFVRTAKGKSGAYTKDGKVILKPKYTAAAAIRWLVKKNYEPLIMATLDKRHKRKYRPIIKNGQQIIKQAQFSGLFDKDGKEILPLKYRSIELIGGGLIEATTGYYDHITYYYFTTDGRPIKALEGCQLSAYYPEYKGFQKGISPVRKGYKFGYADSTGQIIVPLIYDEVKSFTDGFGAVRIKTKWGFVNRQGEVVIPIIFDDVKPFKKGFAAVKFNYKYGLIDTTGKVIVNYEYHDFYDNFPGNILFFYQNGVAKLKGFRPLNADTICFTCEVPEFVDFHKGYGFFKDGGLVKYMDENGKVRPPFSYTDPSGSQNGLYSVKQGDLYGVLNGEYEVVVPFKFQRLDIVNPDRFIVMLRSSMGMYQMALINSRFQEIAPLQYRQLSPPRYGKMFALTDKDMGFIDLNGRELMNVPIPEGYTTSFNWSGDTLTYGLKEVTRISDKQKAYIDWKGTKYFKD